MNVRGDIAFVVHPKHHDGPLTARLDALAERRVVDGVWVYRLRL